MPICFVVFPLDIRRSEFNTTINASEVGHLLQFNFTTFTRNPFNKYHEARYFPGSEYKHMLLTFDFSILTFWS